MNINQYMCNMRVLIGLFLANDTSLDVFYDIRSNVTDEIQFRDDNPPMYLKLIIYINDRHIAAYIFKSKAPNTIYGQAKIYKLDSDTFTGDSSLRVFLL